MHSIGQVYFGARMLSDCRRNLFKVTFAIYQQADVPMFSLVRLPSGEMEGKLAQHTACNKVPNAIRKSQIPSSCQRSFVC
jgi:hypothetical protein